MTTIKEIKPMIKLKLQTKKRITYTNWSAKVFQGFYESPLYNSASLHDIEYNDRQEGYLKENQSYDINFDKFTNDVSKKAVDLLCDLIPADDDIILDFKYISLSSPKYYNYSTDKLNIDVLLNLKKLYEFCIVTNKESFNKYLKDNFTSYSGFISFVSNNVTDFVINFKHKESDFERSLEVMLEYYLLTCIYNSKDDFNNNYELSNYEYKLIEYANNALYENLIIVNEVA